MRRTWGTAREAAGRRRFDGVGHDLRPRPGPARGGGVGRHLLFARGAGRDAGARLGDRAAGQGRARPRGAGRRSSCARCSAWRAGARFVEVPEANNRVTLRYAEAQRRCEQLTGGVPPWTWPELGPMVRDLDAVYVNFISGYEMDLDDRAVAAARLRPARSTPTSTACSSARSLTARGCRSRCPMPPAWFGCFDVVQLNEDEMRAAGPRPARGRGGERWRARLPDADRDARRQGAAYFTGRPVRTARDPRRAGGARPRGGDPTGCGDVFGAVRGARHCSRARSSRRPCVWARAWGRAT